MIDAVEISKIAIDNININIEQFGCDQNVNIIESDILCNELDSSYDIIVSNPPYIHPTEINALDHSVRYYDPKLALTDGVDGLSFYRRILELSQTMLNDGGCIILEFGREEQTEQIINIFSEFTHSIHCDFSNKPRVVELSQ